LILVGWRAREAVAKLTEKEEWRTVFKKRREDKEQ